MGGWLGSGAKLIESDISVFMFFLCTQYVTQISRVPLAFQLSNSYTMPGFSFVLDHPNISVISQSA